MVASGLGITVLPQSSIVNRPDETTMLITRPFQSPAPQRRIAIAWRKNFPRRQAIVALQEAILSSAMAGVTWVQEPAPWEVSPAA